jgi:outer membrane protein assembly factor BamE (lipoprotein component of BamABCDE complex)
MIMKKILLLAVLPFMFTSCFVTRYVSNEQDLQYKFTGSHEEDVVYELGEPNEVTEYQNGGYSYTYELRGIDEKYQKTADQYIRVSFTDEDIVRQVRSTTTTRRKRFSVGRTVFAAVGIPIIIVVGGTIVAVVAAVEAEESSY